jgi:hypothetical protein
MRLTGAPGEVGPAPPHGFPGLRLCGARSGDVCSKVRGKGEARVPELSASAAEEIWGAAALTEL